MIDSFRFTKIRHVVSAGGFIASTLIASAAHADSVEVEVTSSNPNVTLNRVIDQASAVAVGPGGTATASSESWELVCVVPCTKTLDRNAKYFIDGSGITGSSHFILPPAQHVTLDVDTGSAKQRVAGVVLTIVGAILAGVALPVAFVGMDPPKTAGLTVAGIGGAMVIPGIVLWAISGTTVKTREGVELASVKRPAGGATFDARGLVF